MRARRQPKVASGLRVIGIARGAMSAIAKTFAAKSRPGRPAKRENGSGTSCRLTSDTPATTRSMASLSVRASSFVRRRSRAAASSARQRTRNSRKAAESAWDEPPETIASRSATAMAAGQAHWPVARSRRGALSVQVAVFMTRRRALPFLMRSDCTRPRGELHHLRPDRNPSGLRSAPPARCRGLPDGDWCRKR